MQQDVCERIWRGILQEFDHNFVELYSFFVLGNWPVFEAQLRSDNLISIWFV